MKTVLTHMMPFLLGVIAIMPASAKEANPPGVNPQHYQCYGVVETTPAQSHPLVLRDQFGGSENKTAKAALLCNPVSKNHEDIRDRTTHLVCYQIAPGKSVDKKVHIENQFGRSVLSVNSPRLLCVPSLKRIAD
jgi:hypothetical protein